MKYKWSIIIPHCNDYPHIWFTVQTMLEMLRHSFFMNAEIIVVENGSSGEDLRLVRRLMGATDNNDKPRKTPLPGPPKMFARKYIEIPHQLHSKPAINLGAWASEGEYLAFFDSHSGCSRDFFEVATKFMDDNPNVAILHSPIVWSGFHPYRRGRQYKLHLKDRFWGGWRAEKLSDEPYPVAASGNTGMVMRRDAFMRMKGFPSMLRQYGGGEPYIDLLAWMFGYEVYSHPDLLTYHFSLCRSRRYDRNWMTFFRNVCLAAYICGGEKYSKPLLDRAVESQPKRRLKYKLLYLEALKYGKIRRGYVEKNAEYTLDGVFKLFDEREIFY